MKRTLSILLATVLLLALCSCGKTATVNKFGLMTPQNLTSKSDKAANELKKEILNAPDTLKPKKETNYVYYIAQDGIDWQDGLSPETPTTLDTLYSLSLNSGDVVLFKRGDTFRLEKELKPVRNVSYGAYGEGEKPVLLGSLKNYADESLWSSKENIIWELSLEAEEPGQIIFNDGEFIGFRKHTLEEVTQNGDFYYNPETKKIHLMLINHNPGKEFSSIEIPTVSRAFGGWGTTENTVNDLTFENLCIKYFSLFAFNISYTENLVIRNCEMGWIGGRITGSKRDRFGNAIQLWDFAKNANVTNNYIYQIFDAAITFQGDEDNLYEDLNFQNNLIEYCSMNFEFWASGDGKATATSSDPSVKITNVTFKNNILRFGGYGFGGMQRKIKQNQSFVLAWYEKYDEGQIENFTISNNIFDTANCNFYYAPNLLHHLDITDNTYYQKTGNMHYILRDSADECSDTESFAKIIKTVDKNPKEIKWID